MNEAIDLANLQLTTDQTKHMQKVTERGIRLQQARYGTGYPEYRGGKYRGMWFHAGLHTSTGVEAARPLGEKAGLSAAEIAIQEAAYAFHDVEQGRREPGKNEDDSAREFEDEVKRHPLPDVVGHVGSLLIKGTKCSVQDGKVTHQSWDDLLPKGSRDDPELMKMIRVARSLDFVHLYQRIGPLQSLNLYREIKKIGRTNPGDMKDFEGYQANQLHMAQTFEYPEPAAEELYGKRDDRRRLVAHTADVLNAVKGPSRQFTTLQEVERVHLIFAHGKSAF